MTHEALYLGHTSDTVPASDLDRLSLCLGLTLEETEELLAADFLQPLQVQRFDNDGYRVRLRESKRRYYESVKDSETFRANERRRVAESRGKVIEPLVPSGKPTALQKRVTPLEAMYARRAA